MPQDKRFDVNSGSNKSEENCVHNRYRSLLEALKSESGKNRIFGLYKDSDDDDIKDDEFEFV